MVARKSPPVQMNFRFMYGAYFLLTPVPGRADGLVLAMTIAIGVRNFGTGTKSRLLIIHMTREI